MVRSKKIFYLFKRNFAVSIFISFFVLTAGIGFAASGFLCTPAIFIHVLPINQPQDVVVAPNGTVFAVDRVDRKIEIFNENGEFISDFGKEGCEDDEFLDPNGVGTDQQGRIYVADPMLNQVKIFTQRGDFVSKFELRPGRHRGPQGIMEDSPTGANDVAVDSQGNIWVADVDDQLLEVHDKDGNYKFIVTVFDIDGTTRGLVRPDYIAINSHDEVYVACGIISEIYKFDNAGKFMTKFGGQGDVAGLLGQVSGIAVDEMDRVYLADTAKGNIQVFDREGKFLFAFSDEKGGRMDLKTVGGIAVRNGLVFVCELLRNRISVWQLKGSSIKSDLSNRSVLLSSALPSLPGTPVYLPSSPLSLPGGPVHLPSAPVYLPSPPVSLPGAPISLPSAPVSLPGEVLSSPAPEFLKTAKKQMELVQIIAEGEITSPNVFAVDQKGTLYIEEKGSGRIIAFLKDGNSFEFGGRLEEVNIVKTEEEKETVVKFSSKGISSIETDITGETLYICDSQQPFLFVLNSRGELLNKIKMQEKLQKKKQGSGPSGVAVNSRGDFYITDSANGRLEIHDLNGKYKYQITKFKDKNGKEVSLVSPTHIKINSHDEVYVMDAVICRIHRFNAKGNYLGTFGGQGNTEGLFVNPVSMAIDSKDRVYVLDNDESVVQVFSQAGEFLYILSDAEGIPLSFPSTSRIFIDKTKGYLYVSQKLSDREGVFVFKYINLEQK